MAARKPTNEMAVVAFQPQIAAAIAPPPHEPARPIVTVSHTGIGSGPGTARRASAPVTKPSTMIAMTEPIIGGSLGRSLGRGDELAPERLDLVAQLRCVLEPQLLRGGEHLLLQLDDQLLELARRHAFDVFTSAASL